MSPRICLSRVEIKPRICLSRVERFIQEIEIINPEFTKKKNCTDGYSCGNTCISKNNKCRQKAEEDKKPVLESLSKVTATSKTKTTDASAASSQGTDNPATLQPPINESELLRRRELLVQFAGEETVTAFEQNVQRIIDNADLMIRVSRVETLEKIIRDRFKSQFETGTSSGLFDPELRSRIEQMLFGYDINLSPDQRPIYAYLGNKNSDRDYDNVGHFGDISIRLKPEVRKRTTLTGGDSLLKFEDNDFLPPSRLDKVNAGSFFKEAEIRLSNGSLVKDSMQQGAQAKDFDDLSRKLRVFYIEAQIHGQVRSSDIQEIAFFKGERPSRKVLKWAKDNNVNIVVED